MTTPSPIRLSVSLLQSDNKGSTYGQAFSSSYSHSFQKSSGNGGFDNQDRIQVLYAQVALYPAQSSCIIRADELTMGPRITRSPKTRANI